MSSTLDLRRRAVVGLLVCLIASYGAYGAPRRDKQSEPKQDTKTDSDRPNLETILEAMNRGAEKFRTAKADFRWVNYTKAVDEKDIQSGTVYFRRRAKDDMDAALHIEKPAPKQIVYQDGKVRMYEPRTDQVTERAVGKNKADVDALISLGFGGSGDQLQKSFDITVDGWEVVDHTKTARLELVPKSPNLQKLFSKVILWIDPVQDVPLQQQWLFESGDYKLTNYNNIKTNKQAKVSDGDFKLNTNRKTQNVSVP